MSKTVNDQDVAMPRLLSLRDAAKYAGLSPWTVRGLVWDGQLATVKLPGRRGGTQRRVWIDRGDLDRLIERSKAVEPATW